MERTPSVFTSINYTGPVTCTESTLSVLSKCFHITGHPVYVMPSAPTKVMNNGGEEPSWCEVVSKILAYLVVFPITLLAFIVYYALRSQYEFTLVCGDPNDLKPPLVPNGRQRLKIPSFAEIAAELQTDRSEMMHEELRSLMSKEISAKDFFKYLFDNNLIFTITSKNLYYLLQTIRDSKITNVDLQQKCQGRTLLDHLSEKKEWIVSYDEWSFRELLRLEPKFLATVQDKNSPLMTALRAKQYKVAKEIVSAMEHHKIYLNTNLLTQDEWGTLYRNDYILARELCNAHEHRGDRISIHLWLKPVEVEVILKALPSGDLQKIKAKLDCSQEAQILLDQAVIYCDSGDKFSFTFDLLEAAEKAAIAPVVQQLQQDIRNKKYDEAIKTLQQLSKEDRSFNYDILTEQEWTDLDKSNEACARTLFRLYGRSYCNWLCSKVPQLKKHDPCYSVLKG